MIQSFEGNTPEVHESAYIHPNATVIGQVEVHKGASIWPGCVLRGDIEPIVIGEDTSFQDASVAHTREGYPTILGKRVVIGHSATVHGAVVGDDAMVGMGASMLDGSELGAGSILAAGALLKEGDKVPPGMLAVGVPAKVVREVKPEEVEDIKRIAREYAQRGADYKKEAESAS